MIFNARARTIVALFLLLFWFKCCNFVFCCVLGVQIPTSASTEDGKKKKVVYDKKKRSNKSAPQTKRSKTINSMHSVTEFDVK